MLTLLLQRVMQCGYVLMLLGKAFLASCPVILRGLPMVLLTPQGLSSPRLSSPSMQWLYQRGVCLSSPVLACACPRGWHVPTLTGCWICFVFVYVGSVSTAPTDVVILEGEGWEAKADEGANHFVYNPI